MQAATFRRFSVQPEAHKAAVARIGNAYGEEEEGGKLPAAPKPVMLPLSASSADPEPMGADDLLLGPSDEHRP